MIRRTSATVLVLVVTGVLIATAPMPAAQMPRLDLPALLTTYANGRFDDAVGAVRRADDDAALELRRQWPSAVRTWIEVAPAERPRRMLAAAGFALETESLRVERNEWGAGFGRSLCSGVCVMDWARRLLIERGAPDEVERAWLVAAIALAEGVRDAAFVHAPIDPRLPFDDGRGLASSAIARFPDEPRFRLARAMAIVARFNITTDGMPHDQPLPAALTENPIIASAVSSGVVTREVVRAAATVELTTLGEDPIVGVEARIRLGYMHWAMGHDAAARPVLEEAARLASNPDLRYLAHFLLGKTAETQGDVPRAIDAYGAALAARPHSQSASLALAALELQRGEATRAYELSRDAVTEQPPGRDPWRQFLYGHYPDLPALLARFRAQITQALPVTQVTR